MNAPTDGATLLIPLRLLCSFSANHGLRTKDSTKLENGN